MTPVVVERTMLVLWQCDPRQPCTNTETPGQHRDYDEMKECARGEVQRRKSPRGKLVHVELVAV
jgi:hypothetical protein